MNHKNNDEMSCYFLRGKDEILTSNFSEVVEFVANELAPYQIQSINRRYSSYAYKHMVENKLGKYVSNLDFKVACAMHEMNFLKASNYNTYYSIGNRLIKRVFKV